MISFAIGGLLGDVFFHTLPHMSGGHGHGHGHGHEHSHDHSGEEGGHSHEHSTDQMFLSSLIVLGIVAFFLIEKISMQIFGESHTHDEKNSSHSHEDKEKENRYKAYTILALIGDFTHNFTDGLSIGVAYVAGILYIFFLNLF